MINISRTQIIFVLVICLFGFVYAAPNVLPRQEVEDPATLAPVKQVNLGLDLQGGLHLLLEADIAGVLTERMDSLENSVRAELRTNKIRVQRLGISPNNVLSFNVTKPEELEAARRILQDLEPQQIDILQEREYEIESDGQRLSMALTESALERLRISTLQQTIEVLSRRLDETGTKNVSLQRQGDDRVLIQIPGVDNPESIKSLLRQTAKLTFRLVHPTEVPGGRAPTGYLVLPEDERSGTEGIEWLVTKRVYVSGENLVDAQPAFDTNGRPAVSFRFDGTGGRRFGKVTSENVGRPLAIVLDNKVISAPRINEPIPGGTGIITGNFTVEEANELALLLRAGALPADLRFLEERTVGPGLGADSIAAGQIACIIGLILVMVFMVASYGMFGAFACVALLVNLVLILAVLSLLQATLTLPGIAGIVLTIGMAVDANVLIFERIREEIRNGRGPISSIDSGYRRALTTILDANLTTLIAAVLLYAFGTGPIKGFAVTLAIGIVTSLFTAIMVTRLLVVTWLRRARPQAVPI